VARTPSLKVSRRIRFLLTLVLLPSVVQSGESQKEIQSAARTKEKRLLRTQLERSDLLVDLYKTTID
jgi:hypothetical protein